jgi:hypothetical protein
MISSPEYYGLTPSILGVGRDDGFFFNQATNFFPEGFPIHRDINNPMHPYSNFLIIISYPLRQLINFFPLDLMLLNASLLSLLPYAGYLLAETLFDKKKISFYTYLLLLFSPFLFANGLILVRDGLIALFFTLSLYSSLKKKYLLLILSLVLLFYLRLASGILSLGSIIFLTKLFSDNKTYKFYFQTFFILVILFAIVVINYEYINTVLGGNIFFRETFADTFVSQFEGSALSIISSYPFIVRVPIGTIYFILSPFIVSSVYNSGYFSIISIFSIFYSLLNIFLIYYFVIALITYFRFKERKYIYIFVLFIIMMLILSQMSLQIRHKTMLMPIYYLLVAYGINYNKDVSTYKWIAYFTSLTLILVNIYILVS